MRKLSGTYKEEWPRVTRIIKQADEKLMDDILLDNLSEGSDTYFKILAPQKIKSHDQARASGKRFD